MKSSKPKRLTAGQKAGIGNARYALIKAAAAQVVRAREAGFFLEAVTLVESILSERLEKRAQFFHRENPTVVALSKVQHGFNTLGDLINALSIAESDSELKTLTTRVDGWRKLRNRAVHQMAKLGEGAEDPWSVRVEEASDIADEGINTLLAYDREERRVSHRDLKRDRASATCPDALSSLGQEWCEHCTRQQSVDRKVTGRRTRRGASADSNR